MDTEPSPDPESAPAPQTPPAPLTIKISGEGSQRYKSIDTLEWENIPPFAILTGLNGSGKTQLLELIYFYYLDKTNLPNQQPIGNIKIDIQGYNFMQGDVAYLPATQGNLSATTIGPQIIQNLLTNIKSNNTTADNLINKARKYVTNKSKKSPNSLTDRELMEYLGDFNFALDEIDVIGGISSVYLKYKMNYNNMCGDYINSTSDYSKCQIIDEIKRKIGAPPWDLVNDILRVAEFPYQTIPPKDTSINYTFSLKDDKTNVNLQPNNLSSGEQTLFRLALWLYNYDHGSKKTHQPAKLLLLDEPDAFLHPSMTRQFMNVINEVLVQKHGIRVIMTTHSPSTVALAPEGSVFVMSREPPRIQRETSRDKTIGLLTAGLVVVSPATRFVLVEDKDDVEFYKALWDILSDQGPSRDKMALDPAPSIVFLPASRNREPDGNATNESQKQTKIAGGKTVVAEWVKKFNEPPLNQFFRGIVDGEATSLATDRILALERHSIENYLCDPLIIYALLNEEGKAPAIDGLTISRGEEYRIRDCSQEDLQKIINSILENVKSKYSEINVNPQTRVDFTNGSMANYPVWFLNERGHDLLSMCQCCFGSKLITPPKLRNKLRVIRLIPKGLAEIMHKIQGPIDSTTTNGD